PTGASPASAATAARSRARRIGGGSGKAMAWRALARRLASVMPSRRERRTSAGGVLLGFLRTVHFDDGDVDLGLVALHLDPRRVAICFTASTRDRASLPLKCWRLAAAGANRAVAGFDSGRPRAACLTNVE